MDSKRFDSEWHGELQQQAQKVGAVEFLALMLSRRQLDRGLRRHTCVLIDRNTGEVFSASDFETHRLGSLAMR